MSRSRFAFPGSHAIITGGSSGIGLEIAKQLRARGCSVSVIARDPEKLARLEAQIDGVRTASADVTDVAALKAAVDLLVEKSGPCDLLITCAGAAHPGYFLELGDQVFRDQMELDYFGTLNAIKAVLPSMVERGSGTVVGVSSVAGLIGVFGYSAYGASKFAVRGLLESLRAEMRSHGVKVLCAYPPDTDTPGFETENLLKPRETAAISAGMKLRTADDVATSIVKGIEKQQVAITTDLQSALLVRIAGLLRPMLDAAMARSARKAK